MNDLRPRVSDAERVRRWRLVLGRTAEARGMTKSAMPVPSSR